MRIGRELFGLSLLACVGSAEPSADVYRTVTELAVVPDTMAGQDASGIAP
jgi:hypothetical protein